MSLSLLPLASLSSLASQARLSFCRADVASRGSDAPTHPGTVAPSPPRTVAPTLIGYDVASRLFIIASIGTVTEFPTSSI